jgi:hypothetical protein
VVEQQLHLGLIGRANALDRPREVSRHDVQHGRDADQRPDGYEAYRRHGGSAPGKQGIQGAAHGFAEAVIPEAGTTIESANMLSYNCK